MNLLKQMQLSLLNYQAHSAKGSLVFQFIKEPVFPLTNKSQRTSHTT